MQLQIAVSIGVPRTIRVELFSDGFRLLEAEGVMIDASPNAVSFNAGKMYQTQVEINDEPWDGRKVPQPGDRISLHNTTQNRTYRIGVIAPPSE